MSPRPVYRNRLLRSFAWSLAIVAGGACSDGGGDDAESLTAEVAASYEGIYRIDSWTQNETGCEGEGADQTATAMEEHFVVVAVEYFGQTAVELVSCLDVADCENTAQAIAMQGGYTITFRATLSEPDGEDALWGFSASTGFENEGQCTKRTFEDHALVRDGDTLRLDTVVKALADRPAEDGFCVVQPREAIAEAEDAPCSSARSIAGTAVADL